MAGSVNKVILVGNLGKDPEIRRLDNNAAVASFSLATTESFVDKNTGERRDSTDWHNIVAWRGLAEICEKYVRKGMKVYIEGKLRTRSWNDKEGNTRYTTEVVAEDLVMMSRSDNPEGAKPTSTQVYSTQNTPTPPSRMPDVPMNTPFEDDDLPF
jgi:single-strand DNA-binding protein